MLWINEGILNFLIYFDITLLHKLGTYFEFFDAVFHLILRDLECLACLVLKQEYFIVSDHELFCLLSLSHGLTMCQLVHHLLLLSALLFLHSFTPRDFLPRVFNESNIMHRLISVDHSL
jgi:hypothetical protein